MVQLIIDGVELPESHEAYSAVLSEDAIDVQMISGRMVREITGEVWLINYQYGYFDDATKERIMTACNKGYRSPIVCSFVTPTGEMKTSSFWVMSRPKPVFFWSHDGRALWGNFEISLREAKPHD